MSRLERWWRSWVSVLSRTEDGRALAAFRIGIGLSLLYTFVLPLQDGAIAPIWLDNDFGGIRNLSKPPWLIALLGGATPTVIWGTIAAVIGCGLLLVLGIWARAAALIGMVLMNNYSWLNSHAVGGHDDLIANALWLLVFANSTATWSLRCKLKHGQWSSDEQVMSWPRQLAVAQLIVMYSSTGLQKLSAHWVPFGDMTALWYIMLQPTWARYDLTWLAPYAWTTKIATFMTWCFEIGAPLYWWFAHAQATADRQGQLRRWTNRLRLRECFVAFGLSMHIGIWVLMEVGPFSIASIAYYACLRRGKVSTAEDQ